MLRKIMIVLIGIAAIGAVTIPTDVSARGGHSGARSGGHFGGFRGGGLGGFRGGLGYRGYGYSYGYAYGSSCWRWYGPRRVWVCGGYPYY